MTAVPRKNSYINYNIRIKYIYIMNTMRLKWFAPHPKTLWEINCVDMKIYKWYLSLSVWWVSGVCPSSDGGCPFRESHFEISSVTSVCCTVSFDNICLVWSGMSDCVWSNGMILKCGTRLHCNSIAHTLQLLFEIFWVLLFFFSFSFSFNGSFLHGIWHLIQFKTVSYFE